MSFRILPTPSFRTVARCPHCWVQRARFMNLNKGPFRLLIAMLNTVARMTRGPSAHSIDARGCGRQRLISNRDE